MPPAVIAGVAAAGAIGSGIAGSVQQNNASKRSRNLARDAAQGFTDIEDPNYQAMMLQLEEMKSQGLLTPEMEQAILQNPSEMQNVQIDPRLQKSEMDALDTLSKISGAGGMDPQAMLAMRQAQLSGQNQARGAREANLQSAASRGVAGSGLEFVSNQMADQDAAGMGELVGLQNASAANQRDMDALSQMAGIGGNVTNRQLGLDTSKGTAQDAINRFNTQIRGDVQQRNVEGKNIAQESNLKENQRIADTNTLLRNQQQQYNKSLEQQKFDNSMAKAQGAAGLVGAQTSAMNQASQNAGNLWGGIGQTLAGTGSSLANYYAQKEKPKYDQNGNLIS